MADEPGSESLQWSMKRFVELLDEAIDSAGAQLARGQSLMAWRDPVRGVTDDEAESPIGTDL
ncbi:hypothetical protein AB0P21_39350 [Kribbella sp. NPDC056861]|uniref:hypothetical protein n=1 Tax=Kribbella sp. NPDC056861 TaxID=3154857 RepID=UPI0034466BDA